MPRFRLADVLDTDLARYLTASVAALAVDTGIFSLCLRGLGFGLGWAATLGFAAGAVVAYLLSIHWVFRARTLRRVPVLEFLTFVGIGVVGLGITQLVLWIGVSKLGQTAELVKLMAAAATFTFNFFARKTLLFAASRRNRTALETLG